MAFHITKAISGFGMTWHGIGLRNWRTNWICYGLFEHPHR